MNTTIMQQKVGAAARATREELMSIFVHPTNRQPMQDWLKANGTLLSPVQLSNMMVGAEEYGAECGPSSIVVVTIDKGQTGMVCNNYAELMKHFSPANPPWNYWLVPIATLETNGGCLGLASQISFT